MIIMEKTVQLYEGKAKRVYATTDEDIVLVSYKDDATAFNGLKKGTILGKGVVNNVCSNHMFRLLEEKGIPTHYVEEINERETYVKKVEIVPLEVIIRNRAAGSFSKRYGVAEGTALSTTVIEFSYKNDDLGDPLINEYHALALNLATKEEIEKIKTLAFKVNDYEELFFRNRRRTYRLQTRIRKIQRRYNPCGRNFSGYLPFLGCEDGRETR